MKTEKIVIFDFDGTLFQTAPVDIKAVNDARRYFNIPPLAPHLIQQRIGLPTSVFIEQLKGAEHIDSARFEEIFTRFEVEALRGQGRLFEGVPGMLQRLYGKALLAICSHGNKPYLDAACGHFDIGKYFSLVFYEHVGVDKTQAASIILKELAVSRGVFVGDREVDIRAGRLNGLLTVGVTLGYGKDEPYLADYTAHSVEEMEKSILFALEELDKAH